MRASPIEEASEQIRAVSVAEMTEADKAEAVESARTLKADGSWPDIDYANSSRADWPAANHPIRMAKMAALAAADEKKREELVPKLHKAFAYWMAHDFQCPNWWHNLIGVPKQLGACGILLGKDLLPEERKYLVGTLLPRSKIARTGQNRLWLAGNTFLLGLLSDDKELADKAVKTIWEAVQVSPQEGIQPDSSFHQHGAQQQFGTYGLAFALDISRWMVMLQGTPWEMPARQKAIFRDYLLKGQNLVCWRGMMDISSCGRQLEPGIQAMKAANVGLAMSRSAGLDTANEAAYKAFAARNVPGAANDLTGSKHFWRSDYTVHRGGELFATLKMSSNRVIGTESLNSENLSGYHLADGVLYLYRTGREYDGIFPVWDWRNLPGTTTSQQEPPAFKNSSVPTDFVGGVSAGSFGVSAMDYAREGVKAKKAWFFSGDEVDCLGTDIGSDSGAVVTTLNQTLLEGPVTSKRASGEGALASGNYADLSWVEQAGLRYTLLEPSKVRMEAGPSTGNWSRVFISPTTPKDDVTLSVFTLQIPHGEAPADASYAWAVSLAGTEPKGKALSNTKALQAVKLGGEVYGLVFWEAGNFTTEDGMTVEVDTPCVAIVLPNEKKLILAEPTRKVESLKVSVAGVTQDVALPRAGKAGSAVEVALGPPGS